MTSCKHGMPIKFGCDECHIADLAHRLKIMQMERDAARVALNFLLQSNKHVATIVSWTNDGYHRNYKIEWHDNNLPERTMLFAKVPSYETK